MKPRALAAEIEGLPLEDQVKVERYVRSLASRRAGRQAEKAFPDELLQRINARREELRRKYGLFDTLPIIREFREHGARGNR